MTYSAWSDDMIRRVKRNWTKKPLGVIASELGISIATLYYHLNRLDLTPPPRQSDDESQYRRREWTAEEDEYLVKHYHVKDIIAISKALKRTQTSVFHRAQRIGLAFVQQRHLLNRDEIGALLGVEGMALKRRYTDARFPIPCIRTGRFVQFDEYDVMEWLKAGHILAFDRAKIAPHLRRIYDGWASLTISSTDVFNECEPIGQELRRDKDGMTLVTIRPINQMIYYKADIYALAYRYGNRIPPWASERFRVIRNAWDTEFVLKADVIANIGARDFTYRITPHLTTSDKFYAKRTDICRALRRMGREDLAKQYTDVAIPWTEMMVDYEKRSVR
jgi:predicted DNA-binding transcriptional regulator AlpA